MLENDSTYPLIAIIYNAQGEEQGQVPVQPGQTYIWTLPDSPFSKQMNRPYTPYTVEWMCNTGSAYNYNPRSKDKKKKSPQYVNAYGTWDTVGVGAYVNALGSPSGSRTCVVKKHKKAPKKKESFNNFSNDGGQTWNNDAGPGWDAFDDEDFQEVPTNQ